MRVVVVRTAAASMCLRASLFEEKATGVSYDTHCHAYPQHARSSKIGKILICLHFTTQLQSQKEK
jgi:hypothetical protein